MISLDIKQSSSTDTLPLNISSKDEKPTLSFASLLNAVGSAKKDIDSKSIQNGILSLALDDVEESASKNSNKSSKKADILSLLKNEKEISLKKDDEPLELNPKISTLMSSEELKTVIHQAKKYIKSQIVNSEAFKKKEIESLPKTLKGLVQVAKKIGIDISKITLEKVQEQPVELKTPLIKTASLKLSKKGSEIELKTQVTEKKAIKIADVTTDAVEVEITLKQKASNIDSNVDRNVREKLSNAVGSSNAVNSANDIVKVPKAMKQKVATAQGTSNRDKNMLEQNKDIKQEVAVKDVPKMLKETPLFKAQVKTEITTAELVNAKAIITEPKNVKEKVQNSLELLLRGEKVSDTLNKNSILTADFSVATAKVIAPTATRQTVKSLESLLKNSDTQSDETKSKTDGLNVAKADSFEVKLNEAKQMVKYLSQDVKSAIQDYKSPFTRIKVQLNPQKLGEVDLTIVQRGKNLHINLSSNNVAINTLAMNANDLKVQLSNNGINNATLNFNNTPQGGDNSSGSQMQQQQQQREEAQEKYNFFDKEERNEEVLNSLEIVVPHYA